MISKAAAMMMMMMMTAFLVFPDTSLADPRTQMVKFMCGNQPERNRTIYVPNFVATMENISTQMRSSGFGLAKSGTGPDTNYGLAQCYGDLSLVDCVLCYAEARTVLPQCYPNTGGRIYLDGCFMRAENYSFFHEYKGPDDHAVCGNITRKHDSAFQASVRRALSMAVLSAPNSNGYARGSSGMGNGNGNGNESAAAYVLADCWSSISVNACRACLENASAVVSRCLPQSEGRALNTGCFMRYSDTNFLNPLPGGGNGTSTGKIVAGVIAAASAAAVIIVGMAIGIYMWKHTTIQKKRKGDAAKLVKTLNDSSLNFKYSTLDKATSSFDEANKLGQGGFGTVYMVIVALTDPHRILLLLLLLNLDTINSLCRECYQTEEKSL